MSHENDNPITFLARTSFRNNHRLFGIKTVDRRAHLYLIGKTGCGKSTLMETMMLQDMAAGHGFGLLDPHGDLLERVLAKLPERRRNDLIYFNVPDRVHPLGFNPLESIPADKRPLAASGLLEVFKKIWAEFWGPRSEHILRNALLALLDQPQATLADILRLLDDASYRKHAAERVRNAQVRDFWLREYESYPARFRAEAIAPLQNKVGAFLANPILHQIVTQPKSSFDLRNIMDEGKILLVNLAKGLVGEDVVSLLGSLLVGKMGLAASSRSDVPEEERRDFYLYLDEFQSFTTLSFANMLSELRKYRLNMVLSHQYLAQVAPGVRDAIHGNVGTIICFRIGPIDADLMEKEFFPELSAIDFINLPNYHIYIKLLVNGVVTKPFSGETIRLLK
jgi:hypothetical protein